MTQPQYAPQGYAPQQYQQQPDPNAYAQQAYQQPAPQGYAQPQQPQGYAQPNGYAQPQQYAPPVPQQYPGPQGYAPQQYPGPQGYAPQQAQPQQPPAPAGPPPAVGSIDGFFNQPSTGWGPGLPWKDVPEGTYYTLRVARDITGADIEHQTVYNNPNQLDYYRDGRPKFVMKVPGYVVTAPDMTKFPDGQAQWFVAGAERDELVRAMAEAGAPAGPPERDAVITITLTGRRRNGMGTLSPVKHVRYQRPDGQVSSPAQVGQQGAPGPVAQAPQQPQAPAGQQGYAQPQAQPPAPQQQQQQAPAPQQYAPPVPQQQAPVAQQQNLAQPPAPGGAPGELDPEQQALLARLTNGQG